MLECQWTSVPPAVKHPVLQFLFEQVVERKRTPAEIREEFERLQREREERRLQQRTNPKVGKGFMTVSTPSP